MANNNNQRLCLALAEADTEIDVINLLKESGYWNDESAWEYYGDNENNFSAIGNQQSLPEVALVEKLVNSIDAVLMRECLRKGINPTGKDAPENMERALTEFFGIYGGKLTNLNPGTRAALANNIMLVATGGRSNPSYSIIDLGEGQTPEKMPDTFMSLSRSNKLRIPFVQGKFNMGGTGAFLFCGQPGGNNLQLLISRRDPSIASRETDTSKDDWGFTIIRRANPKEGMRSSVFKYLRPNKKILRFNSPKGIRLLPCEYPKAQGDIMQWGTFIKLYEYQLTGALKTLIKFDLYYRLSLLMPNVALPISMVERRQGYKARNFESTLSGLNVRLEEDKGNILEDGFPSSSEIEVAGQKMKILIYAFKPEKKENYAKKEGVVFTINGQAHGFIPKTFYDKKSVGMSYLSDSILLIVDCSKFGGRTREDLFMNSRDRLRESVLLNEIEKALEELVCNHPGLRELREKRRREEIEDKLQDSKPLAEAIESIIKKSPSLSKLFIEGVRVLNPFKVIETVGEKKFEPRKFPSYFKLVKQYPESGPKQCPINRKFRVQFATDAENEYFNRDQEPGEFFIKVNDEVISNYTLNLWNGLVNLNVELPPDKVVGQTYNYKTEVLDLNHIDPFENNFYVSVIEAEEGRPGGRGNRKGGGKKHHGQEKIETTSYLELPNTIEVRRDSWSRYKFTETSALMIKDSGESGYDFYINMDNVYLRTEIKGGRKIDPRLLDARYKFGLVLIGLSVLDYFEKHGEDRESDVGQSKFDRIAEFSTAISPVLLPIIESLGDLDI